MIPYQKQKFHFCEAANLFFITVMYVTNQTFVFHLKKVTVWILSFNCFAVGTKKYILLIVFLQGHRHSDSTITPCTA